VDVGSTDRRRGDADEGIVRSHLRDGFFIENDSSWFDKECGFHGILFPVFWFLSPRQLLPSMEASVHFLLVNFSASLASGS
jgi:hypothetical protein